MLDLRSMRVSLKFSEKDADHIAVAKLLKQLGRKKASFIVKAVKYYMENNPMPEIPGTNAVVTSMVTEAMVKATIMKMMKSGELSSDYYMALASEPRAINSKELAAEEKKEKKEVKEKPVKKVEPKKPVEVKEEPSEEDYLVETDTEKKEDTAAIDAMLGMLDDF